MFFVMLMVIFGMVGTILIIIDYLLPGIFIPFVAMGIEYMGVMLMWCGIMVYLARAYSTGGALLVEMPNPNVVKLFHIGNSGAKLMNSVKGDLNSLLVRGKRRMRVKDMGHSIPVAGHEVQFSYQTEGFTIPIIVLDAIDKWKNRYGVRDKKEFLELYKQIRGIKSYGDLRNIEFLKPIMADPQKAKLLLDISLDDLRNMSELLFDGHTINIKSYKDWDESANPYDNESIISRTIAHRAEQRTSYRFAGGMDWAKIIIPIIILFIGGAIAYQIFGS